jgi:hypothetical protein
MTEAQKLPRGYQPLLDFDYGFLSVWEDLILTAGTSKPCYSCGKPTDRFNATIGGYECNKCGISGH